MREIMHLDPAHAALLLVDLQEEHRRDVRVLVEGYAGVLANAARLLAAARAAGVAVLHSAFERDFARVPRRPLEPAGTHGRADFSDPEGGLTAICPEVAPAPDEPVLVKDDASAFADGALARRLVAEWLVVAGVWTEACVAATVRDAVAAGLRVLLVRDAMGSGTALMHRTGVLDLANRLHGGAAADTARAVRLLRGKPAPATPHGGLVPHRYTAETVDALYEAL